MEVHLEINDSTESSKAESKSSIAENNTKCAKDESKSPALEVRTKSAKEESKSSVLEDSTKPAEDKSKPSGLEDSTKPAEDESKPSGLEDSTKPAEDESKPSGLEDRTKPAKDEPKSFVLEDNTKSVEKEPKSSVSEDGPETTEEDGRQPAKEEIDGSWMQSLRKAVNLTIDKSVAPGSYRVFAKSFPSLHQQYPHILKSLREQFITKFQKAVQIEVSNIYEQHDMVRQMNELEELSKQAEPDVRAWRPTGNVGEDLRAHTYPLKLKQRDRLRKLAQTLDEEHKQLQTAVEARRQKFINTQKAIKDHVAQVDQAYTACSELPLQKLTDFLQKEYL